MTSWVVNSAANAVSAILDTFAKLVWGFVNPILIWIFSWMDKSATPSIAYSPNGPTAAIWPYLEWVGAVLAFCFAMWQIGTVAAHGGQGMGTALVRYVKWAFAYLGGLAILSIVLVFSNGLAKAIVSAGFDNKGWSGLADQSSFMGATVQSVSGVGLAIVSLFFIIPFAFFLVTEEVIRMGGIEILAATYPILVAGLLHESMERWFYKGMRWMLALIFMLPTMALAMAVSHGLVMAASKQAAGGGQALAMMMVGAAAGSLGLLAPVALFKLFAFVDPNTGAGASARSWMASRGGDGATPAPSSAPSSDGSDTSGVDARTDAASNESGTSAASSGGGLAAAGGTAASAAKLFAGDPTMANRAHAHAASSFDSWGVGHPGGPDADDPNGQGTGSGKNGPQRWREQDGDAEPTMPMPPSGGASPVPTPPTAPTPQGPAPTPPTTGGGAASSGGAQGAGSGAAAADAAVVAI